LALKDVTTDGEAKVGLAERNVQGALGHRARRHLDSQVVLGLEHKCLFGLGMRVAWLCRAKLILRHGRAKKE
jgi:hypothetical protein